MSLSSALTRSSIVEKVLLAAQELAQLDELGRAEVRCAPVNVRRHEDMSSSIRISTSTSASAPTRRFGERPREIGADRANDLPGGLADLILVVPTAGQMRAPHALVERARLVQIARRAHR